MSFWPNPGQSIQAVAAMYRKIANDKLIADGKGEAVSGS
jgi:hypothetical protein